ncbi:MULTISPECIES: bifunctional 3,4-dihydroxy-2-butanone-4-phosphate synthase/GTP cyclohydrolase II [Rhodococcus]|uniref:Riboflavin biosynthesis protein RibBA n=1 Tax=Rhodococcus oxybenzonivorans TaxID=1990687 RepID=A0AAE4V152_9NOCA|nr:MULTISPECIES: bifunctional 3,4-dihydroxy-2-butanone-4-phosphate synthase/GTP cyclohydrolase II [Rhodococcus]MDV7241125.1 bifunctional 3,4-dihydroxy-2-butanone-4-phosphate synthase/GTP cyclohydrolase II [Rhodococcus oxybenzonivorans]MDV7266895.1 bifunctional 3,4-dihydroxy-2-butanone-4-phosphate synthase/GTP cyclohydrolase II [Rhodococcus oxybenzonivorans]MDV7273398.1 bifunctional 3,4-dihydroxy-2-butanone-4-phosphate synthase/GTP cyclohydrolase II [Rhodococcus oxybenzonivorans]MDV7332864.1 bif
MMSSRHPHDAVDHAVAALAAGRMIIVIDDADRENEGDLVVAASSVTDEQMAFIVRHSTGIVCAPMTVERAAVLRLPLMVEDNTDAYGTAFTVTVDHVDTGTGVSATDRAATVHALADDSTAPADLRRPGHIFPLRARPGGVLVRSGHTEASVDLVRLAGAGEVAVISEIVADDGSMRRGEDLLAFADAHGLPVLHIGDLVRYRNATESQVEQVSTSSMPTAFGQFRAVAYRSSFDGIEHLALVMGDVAAAGRTDAGVLVRVHSECLTGDVLGSLRCDCGTQLEQALAAIADEGCGVLVYLRGHEGRGIGLAHKICAYDLQDQGLDTVDANLAQGLPVDARSYEVGAHILIDLGVRRLRLITNNPAKYDGLDGHSLELAGRVQLPTAETDHNIDYLRTKRDRLGHHLEMRPTGLAPRPRPLVELSML